jgi:acetolactate synthase-1/2/3 large subunit
VDIPHFIVDNLDNFASTMAEAIAINGPAVVEVDMTTIGPFKSAFAGPPKRTK